MKMNFKRVKVKSRAFSLIVIMSITLIYLPSWSPLGYLFSGNESSSDIEGVMGVQRVSESHADAGIEWWDEGAQWGYDTRRKATVIEPGVMNRSFTPIDIQLKFSQDECANDSIRVLHFNRTHFELGGTEPWVEVPSQIWNETFSAGNYSSCNIVFLTNLSKGESQVFYIYYSSSNNTPPSYDTLINAIAKNIDAPDETKMPWVYNVRIEDPLKRNATNVDALNIYTYKPFEACMAQILLTDTIRINDSDRWGDEWGGPSCSLISLCYRNETGYPVDALSTNNGTSNNEYILIGEFAFDPPGDDQASGGYSKSWLYTGAYIDRAYVSPDNPAEAWVNGSGVWILDDGPLFVRIKIVTSDGGFSNDTSEDLGNNRTHGSDGFLNYTFTYTFYYHGNNLLTGLVQDIEVNIQDWNAGNGAYVKNYGDWPHIMAIVCNESFISSRYQNMHAWNGTLNPSVDEDASNARSDFALEIAWVTLYDNNEVVNGKRPSLGFTTSNYPIGWEYKSLNITPGTAISQTPNGPRTIGDTLIMQQYLPEGHQGSLYEMTGLYTYNYYIMTSGFNDISGIRDTALQVNNENVISVGSAELFSHNVLSCTVKDVDGNRVIPDVNVTLFLLPSNAIFNSTFSDGDGNCTFGVVPDGNYNLTCFYTISKTVKVFSSIETFDHTIARQYYLSLNVSLALLNITLEDWSTSEIISNTQVDVFEVGGGGQTFLTSNVTDSDGVCSFLLFVPRTYVFEVQLGQVVGLVPSEIVLTQHRDLVLRAVIDTHLELVFVDSGNETVPAGVSTWFTVYLNDTDHNEGIAGANLTILGVEHASYVDMSQSVGPEMAGYYNVTVWSSEISGDQSFRIKAYASHSLFGGGDVTFYLKVTKRPVNPEVFTQAVSVIQGEDAIFTFTFKDGLSNSTLEDVLVSFFWERDLGELEYVEDEGVWRLVINTGDVEPDQFLITVSFFVDPNYEDDAFYLTLFVSEKPPREGIPLWAFIAFTLVVGFVSAGSIAWYTHYRKPWIVRRIDSKIKALEKGDMAPYEGLSREETVKGLMEKDYKIIEEK